MTDEPTRRIVILRKGLELTRLAETPGGARHSETFSPVPGDVLELPDLQAERLLRNGAADFVKECASC